MRPFETKHDCVMFIGRSLQREFDIMKHTKGLYKEDIEINSLSYNGIENVYYKTVYHSIVKNTTRVCCLSNFNLPAVYCFAIDCNSREMKHEVVL